jgi:polyhydroxyalkanoate synthase
MTPQWMHAYPARTTFEQMDRLRRWRGMLLDAAGFAPKETPYRILHEETGVRLRSYGAASQDGPALLIVPAPIKRAYIWDLAPQTSVVQRCLQQGMRVYLAEWMPLDGGGEDFGLADYADRMLTACVDAIEADSGQTTVILAGHSLGGTLAAIFACLHAQRCRALVLLEAPLHFAESAGRFAPLVAAAPDARFIAEIFGNVPGSFLNAVSVAAAPQEFQWQPVIDFSRCANRDKLLTHMRVERWTHDELALPGKLFTEVVELLYRNDALMRRALRIGGRRIGPRDLTVPLLAVIDPRSDVIPPQSVLPFYEAAASRSKQLLHYEGDTGVAIQHVGVLVGANAHARIWPAIFNWLSGLAHADTAT